jgi:hypothetical protein
LYDLITDIARKVSTQTALQRFNQTLIDYEDEEEELNIVGFGGLVA